ncbi:MAG: hypothetical protein IJX82_09160, partial [Clostridia bacterium]|nr:hypothetical protein [Clostridia bacterium]
NCISPTRRVVSRSVVYHQAEGEYTLMRDDIQPKGLIIYTALCTVMICQAFGLDEKRTFL